jgi:hypothetical protein
MPFQPAKRIGDGLDRPQAAVEPHGDEVRDDLRVGLAGEEATRRLYLPPERLKILDDAVVDDRDAVGRVRMSIRFRRRAVRRPAGVANAGRARKRLRREPLLQIDELATCAATFQLSALKRGYAG